MAIDRGVGLEAADLEARSGSAVSTIVALDGPDGETVSVRIQAIPHGEVSVEMGDRLDATIRRIDTQECVARDGVKMQPVE